jgi:DNA (cytosine-5)-methyltransferase 1
MPRDIPGQWPLAFEMNVVLFAGMGGACDGLEQAGHPVHLAINHDPMAIAVHQHRHPHTRHMQTDILEVCPRAATGGREVGILWASPDCRHFSRAKGGAPVSARVRSLPWVVLRWAGQARPRVIMLENVAEIRTWGPLIARRDPTTGRVVKADGTVAARGERVPVQDQQLVPDKRRAGRAWRAFKAHLRGLGYTWSDTDLCGADYGVPTIRKRLFGVARADGRPIVWPGATHAPRDRATALGLHPWRGAHECIDWSVHTRSIFDRPRPLKPATLRRIARGVVRYVIESGDPFLVPVTHGGAGERARSTREPLPTITTATRGELAMVSATLTREFGNSTAGGGGKAALIAAFLAKHFGGVVGQDIRTPTPTVTTTDHSALAVATMVSLRGSVDRPGRDGTSPDAPLPTISARGTHAGLVLAFLQQYYGTGGDSQGAGDPIHAITTKARHGLVTVTVEGTDYAITDIGMRMLDPEELARAHEFDPRSIPEVVAIGGRLKRVTKADKIRLIGNSVPPRMARRLAEANAPLALDALAAE